MARALRQKPDLAERRRRARWRSFRVFGAVAIGFALLFIGMFFMDKSIGVPREKLVSLYHVHTCGCAHQFKRALEAGGFTVIEYEPESLSTIREKLHTPSALHGCHVAEYLGYFLEGHISPSVLTHIAHDRPQGIGFVTAVTFTADAAKISLADEESSAILLIDGRGQRTTFADPDINAADPR